MIQVHKVIKTFDGKEVLRNLNFKKGVEGNKQPFDKM